MVQEETEKNDSSYESLVYKKNRKLDALLSYWWRDDQSTSEKPIQQCLLAKEEKKNYDMKKFSDLTNLWHLASPLWNGEDTRFPEQCCSCS